MTKHLVISIDIKGAIWYHVNVNYILGGNFMEKKPIRPALRFLLACLILVAATPLISIFFLLVQSLTAAEWMINTVYFVIFVWLVVTAFYFGKKRRNAYLDSLDEDMEYTLKTDILPFLKSEGAEVMISYAIYAILCFVARYTIMPPPAERSPVAMILSMGIDIPLAPINYFNAPIVVDYLICVLMFCVFYCAMALLRRARIRKKWL